MPKFDLVVRGGHVLLPDGIETADVGVSDGRIEVVGQSLGDGREEIDAGDDYVLPGGIDVHVHFNEPGLASWEGWAHGSRALAAGGFTACAEMPLNSIPSTIDAGAFDLKKAAAEQHSIVDFALWGGIVPGNLRELEGLHKRGVVGFKAFMCDSASSNFPASDDATLYQGMRRCAELNALVAVHAENAGIVNGLSRQAQSEGRVTWRDFVASRPDIAELEAISRALFFACETGCALHIVHVSTVRGVRLVTKARQDGVNVTCETCPHYLVLNEEDLEKLGGEAKCAPPLRTGSDVNGLWQAIRDGGVALVASDHSPCPPEMKTGPDFFATWAGISGCQSTLHLLLDEGWAKRGIDLVTLSATISENPAHRFRLDGKGAVAAANDADLTLIDPTGTWPLTATDLHYRHPHSAHIGRRHTGRVTRTIRRGETIFESGQFRARDGGRLVIPRAGTAARASKPRQRALGPSAALRARGR